MGKRVKPKNLLDDEPQIDVVNENTIEEANVEMKQEYSENLLGNGKLTAEAKEKLEKYDALEKTVLDLSKEKEVLETKIAEYVEQLEKLNDAADTIKKLIVI